MIKEAFASGETIALAKMKACEILGVNESDADFEIIQKPSPKMFGIFGGKLAQVRAKVNPPFTGLLKENLSDLLSYMGMKDFELEINKQEDVCYAKITGENINYIVGKHGETLDSMQYIVSLLINNDVESKKFCKVRLDAGNYRERRKKALEMLGEKLAYKALNSDKDIALEPMRSYERKIVHDAIQNIDGVYSWSEGMDEDRHVIISKNRKIKYD